MGNRADLINGFEKQVVFYSDILDDLDVSPTTGQLALATNERDVMNSLRRLVSYGVYEREYEEGGANIRKILFEPMDPITTATLKEYVVEACRREVRAADQQVSVTPDYDIDGYVITVVFTVINNPTPITLTTILQRVR